MPLFPAGSALSNMSTERSPRPQGGSRGGRRRTSGSSSRGPRREGYSRGPQKKVNPIVAFFKKIFGLDKPKKSTHHTSSRPANERREGRPSISRDEQVPRAPRPPREEAPETPPEILSTKLYIGNLSYETSESDLFDLFSKVGSVTNSEVIRDGQSKSKGFGFVEMDSLDKAQEAAVKYHRTDFMGRQIVVAGAKK
ncbi:MAG: RNA-binding protein [Blastochloris sp.]|nr:RNA-binding protein [Blastochloris sp.]